MTIPKQSIYDGVSTPLVETRFIASGRRHLPEYPEHHPEKTALMHQPSDHHHAGRIAVRRDKSRLAPAIEVFRKKRTLNLLRLKNKNTGFRIPSDFDNSGLNVFVWCCNTFRCIQRSRCGHLLSYQRRHPQVVRLSCG